MVNVVNNSLSILLNAGCCVLEGDVNHDGVLDISDLTYFVSYMFQAGNPPLRMEEADFDGNCKVDILDLTYVVNYLFNFGPPPVPCHVCP